MKEKDAIGKYNVFNEVKSFIHRLCYFSGTQARYYLTSGFLSGFLLFNHFEFIKDTAYTAE